MTTTIDNYGLSVSVEPTLEPVSLAEMKDWLRIDHTSDDDLISGLVASARKEVENLTRRSFINRTLIQTQPDFPACDTLVLRASPVSSVTTVAYTDQNGDSQTLSASTQYRVVTDRIRPYIKLRDGITWPSVESGNDSAVTITMVAGNGATAATVAANVQTSIKMVVAYAYENRGDGRPVVRLDQVRRVVEQQLGAEMILEF